jgi:hypothetical protein
MAEQTSDRPLGFRVCDRVQGLIAIWSARRADRLLRMLAWPLNGHTDGWGELLDSLVEFGSECEFPTDERQAVREAITLFREGFQRQ